VSDAVWSGPVGARWRASVEAIPDSPGRGVLTILDGDDRALYRREVAASRSPDVEVDPAHAREWASVISDWLRNRS
jgi:hypothetical protein